MYKHLKLLSLVLLMVLTSCANDGNKSTSEKEKPIVPATQELSGLPFEIKKNLFENCDQIDYTFYNFSFSMSQSEKTAVQSNIALLSDEVQATIPPECKAIGRKYYQINGEIVMEAELYFSEGCLFYIYKDNHKSLYGNKLSEKGAIFYNNIMQQAAKARQQATG